MRCLCRTALIWSALSCSAAVALAQGGPYGAPSLLPLPESGPQLQSFPPAGYSAARNSAATPVSYGGNAANAFGNSYGAGYGAGYGASAYNSTSIRRQAGQPLPTTDESQPLLPPGNEMAIPSPSDIHSSTGAGYPSMSCEQACSSNWGDDCTGCVRSCCCEWFGSISGLVMTRTNSNGYWTTFQTNNNPNQLLNTKTALDDWQGGGEVTVGRWCCGGCNGRVGLEFSYFTIGALGGYANIVSATNQLSTPIDLGGVNIGAQTAGSFFDNAHEHRIWRKDEFQNFEVNFLYEPLCSCSNWVQITGLAGVRYFRFDDQLRFGSVAGGFNFGDNGGVDEAYLGSRVVNNLVGLQIGARTDLYLTPRWSLFMTPKFGVYGNDIYSRIELYRGDGLSVYDIHGHRQDVSFLGEVDLGSSIQVGNNWRVFGGYRAIALAGVGLTDNQFLPFLADVQGFSEIKSNGSMVLHGAFAGVECRF